MSDTSHLISFLVYLASVPIVIYGLLRAQKGQLRGWQSVAKELGLRDVEWEGGFWKAPLAKLSGLTARRTVSFEVVQKSKNVYYTLITVDGGSGISLESEASTNFLGKAFRARELEIGDEPFDAEVLIHGAPERVRAHLDVETRRIVLRMLKGHIELPGHSPLTIRGTVSLVEGTLHAVLPHSPQPPTTQEVGDAARALLVLADRFDRPTNLPARLAATIEHEPLWRVRLQGLQALTTKFADDPATAAAVKHALDDSRDEVRTYASTIAAIDGVIPSATGDTPATPV
jgi:hypothetical protein